jgi:Eukaryotic-type carbonic anhydrase
MWKPGGLIPHVMQTGQSVNLGMNGGFTMEEITRLIARVPLAEYFGSLTTPPCTEGMHWIVAREPMIVDPGVYTSFKRVMRYNARILESSPGSENVLKQLVGKS